MSKNKKIGTVLIVLALVGAGIAFFVGGFNSPAKGKTPAGDGLSGDISSAQKALAVDPADVPKGFCDDLLKKADAKFVSLSDGSKTPVFDAGSTHLVGAAADERPWSDATNVSLSPQTLEAEQTTVCHDPGQAAMVMNGLGGEKVGDKSIFALNSSWMAVQGSPSSISQWAQQCLVKDDVKKHLACYQTMSTTAYLLGMFHEDGVARAATVWNFHVVGPVAGKVPPFELNSKQYRGYFLAVSYTTKSNNLCLKFGFNVGKSKPNGGDQRLVRLACEKQPPTEKCVKNCGSKPKCTHDCGGKPKCPPTPGNEPTGGPHHWNPVTCKWVKENQSFDQQQNGSPADQGVQDNHTSGVNTGSTSGAGSGTSSSTNGGTGSSPSGGGSDGSGGTTADNNPVDTGQGGDNSGSGNGGIVDPG